MPKKMDVVIVGDIIQLKRDQWHGNTAYISNYPGLLDEVKKYTWTYYEGKHAYLNCSKLGVSLHKFVLEFLYGEDKLNEMIGNSNIIEHLDNNGLNCTYENLHVLSENLNKAKAFSIDVKSAALQSNELCEIPPIVTDIYYCHKDKYFQMQIFFNKDLCLNTITNFPVECFILQYETFDNLFIDWLYVLECIKKHEFDIYKHHATRVYEKDKLKLELTEEEKDAVIIERNGIHYLVLRSGEEGKGITYVNHTSFRKVYEEK